MRYPNGKQYNVETKKEKRTTRGILNAGNRGMNHESDINLSNEFYNEINKCLVTKRPTPINIVKVDYSRGAKITDAYFEKQSTTDYNGVFQGKYLDFEAKSTQNKSSFPLRNITLHQIDHLKRVIKHGGIAFFIIEFTKLGEVYLLDASYVINFYEHAERKSIPYLTIKDNGILIKQGLRPRLDYLEAVIEKYF